MHELIDEILVYDLVRHKALCLNKTAAFVWNRCDGHTSVIEIAGLLGRELNIPVEPGIVYLAINQLRERHLLEDSSRNPATDFVLSRRALIRKLGWSTAVALPLITSILAPTSTMAASCQAAGQPCASHTECCPGLQCTGNPFKHCA